MVVLAGDPVRTGLAESLARPGGNVTGLTTLSTELSGKRLEFLRELLPTIQRLGILGDNNPAFALAVRDTEQAAHRMNLSVHPRVARQRDDVDSAFAEFARLGIPAVEVTPGRLFLDRAADDDRARPESQDRHGARRGDPPSFRARADQMID